MDKIIISDISAYGYHGVFKSEKELGQMFNIDLEIELDLNEAGKTDNLEFTVDYVHLEKIVKETVEKNSFNLIEKLAEEISKKVLENNLIDVVKVKVKKPYIPAKDFSGAVSVEIVRKKS